MIKISNKAVEKHYNNIDIEAESAGYHLNPDVEFTKNLIKGLLINKKRYGYRTCPCRLASGKKSDDIDIICPCDYRDPDLNEYGTCYCALYVSQEILDGKKEPEPIPERRSSNKEKDKMGEKIVNGNIYSLSKPVWRCKVCGYLCARNKPPEICPICKAKKERFENFI
jgi:ferredoxin-thioredoxin reductase catalytic subunit